MVDTMVGSVDGWMNVKVAGWLLGWMSSEMVCSMPEQWIDEMVG